MSPHDTRHGRVPYVVTNDAAHHALDDTVKEAIDKIGARARGLILTDEPDARIYERRVAAILTDYPAPVVAHILDELGGDSVRHHSLLDRIAAVQVIVTSAAFWGRLP